ncbi:hypothetical protein [Streptomyces regalis]|uniref:hypothetical protein n=1 Tax=Streptomyces regalis TaxID=68262 RepID=UPI000A514B64|nr:hypothetical protein [Streptomyces regalis]
MNDSTVETRGSERLRPPRTQQRGPGGTAALRLDGNGENPTALVLPTGGHDPFTIRPGVTQRRRILNAVRIDGYSDLQRFDYTAGDLGIARICLRPEAAGFPLRSRGIPPPTPAGSIELVE